MSDERFTIVRCRRCSVLRTVPVPKDLNRYYATDLGESMRQTRSRLHTALKGVLLRAEMRRVAGHVDTQTVVDIGCGAGDFARLLHHRGLRVIAVDSAMERPLMIRDLAAIPYHRMDYERYDIEGFTAPGRFTVVLRHVLEHLKDPSALLRRMVDDGAAYFYIAVPNVACVERRLLGRHWYLWDPPRHLWHFDQASLGVLLDRVGLTVLARGYGTIPNLVPSLYRYLRLRGAPGGVCRIFHPRGAIAGLSAPLNFLTPRNALWVLTAAR